MASPGSRNSLRGLSSTLGSSCFGRPVCAALSIFPANWLVLGKDCSSSSCLSCATSARLLATRSPLQASRLADTSLGSAANGLKSSGITMARCSDGCNRNDLAAGTLCSKGLSMTPCVGAEVVVAPESNLSAVVLVSIAWCAAEGGWVGVSTRPSIANGLSEGGRSSRPRSSWGRRPASSGR
ncbi:hypothetical protein D3C72_1733700 [compost metagenome]